MTHELKIMKRWFEDVQSGKKNFEIRRADRDFKVGDLLLLQEYDHGKYTGREITREVEYIYKGDGTYGVSDMFWILGLKQEPCEDVISRKAVLDEMDKRHKEGDMITKRFIKALPSVQTCEDAVSREAVNDFCHKVSHIRFGGMPLSTEWYAQEDLQKYFDKLPPVQPERPKGHWIEGYDENTNDRKLYCDQCHEHVERGTNYDFCPHCGADMRGE